MRTVPASASIIASPIRRVDKCVNERVGRRAGKRMVRLASRAGCVLSGMLALLLTACANAPWQTGSVWIETTAAGAPLPGANCSVSNERFQRVIITPDTLVVPAHGPLRIVCDKAGYQRIEIVQQPAFDTGPGNGSIGIGIGGIQGNIGLGVGLNLPLGGQRGGYPPRLSIEMRAQ